MSAAKIASTLTCNSCLKNVVALFHVLEKEKLWRKERGQLEGYSTIETFKPIVAVGPSHPLEEEIIMADYFRMFKSLLDPQI